MYPLGRDYRVKYAKPLEKYALVLFERTDEKNYEMCYARGLFNDRLEIKGVVDLWVKKQIDIAEIKRSYEELEIYQDFEYRNPNPDIDKAWTKVKNMFFNDEDFWEHAEWKRCYIELLKELKDNKAFEKLYPFTTHYWLRFSIDKNIKETWELDTYIFPTVYCDEVPRTLDKFYISFGENLQDRQYFAELKEAVNFYANYLNTPPPKSDKWMYKW
ncbi:MAG: hypothetical protein IPM69_09570 [Ignavibacteria bacterium]|nr:hypothetical protein [Ignavibacteria bacterium]